MSSPTVNVKLRENKKGLAQDPIYYKGKELWDPPHGLESFPSLNLYVSWELIFIHLCCVAAIHKDEKKPLQLNDE